MVEVWQRHDGWWIIAVDGLEMSAWPDEGTWKIARVWRP